MGIQFQNASLSRRGDGIVETFRASEGMTSMIMLKRSQRNPWNVSSMAFGDAEMRSAQARCARSVTAPLPPPI